jgi:hypothetical protein
MKTKINYMKKILLLLPIMVLLFLGCNKDDDNTNTMSASNLDGYWDNAEIIVHIQGSEGRFYQIKQGDWLRVWEQGFVSIGSLKFKMISPLKTDEFFQGQELWFRWENLVVQETAFSGNGEFNLRNNGTKLYVNTINPWGSNWSHVEYTRVSP